MATHKPYSQLVGPCTVYVAPVGEAVPNVNATPGGNWATLGSTDGEQSITLGQTLNYFSDNDHQGDVKVVRSYESVMVALTLVDLTQEHFARILDQVGDVSSDAGPPATKTTVLKRGYEVYEYAMLLKGSVHSPYGAYPGMFVIPKGVFEGDYALSFGKDQRAEMAVTFHALEDDDQSSGDELGWWVVQTG